MPVERLVRIEADRRLHHLEEGDVSLRIPHPHGSLERKPLLRDRALHDVRLVADEVEVGDRAGEAVRGPKLIEAAVDLVEAESLPERIEHALRGLGDGEEEVAFSLEALEEGAGVAIEALSIPLRDDLGRLSEVLVGNSLDVLHESLDRPVDIPLIRALAVLPALLVLGEGLQSLRRESAPLHENIYELDEEARAEQRPVDIEDGHFLHEETVALRRNCG
ncbi:MAG TPA: hypothetical protein VD967_03200 [Candidatus Paceibacterota bacterium]|nr:hypothetical protein [Candidatus Paceibacterota bacterium]